MCCAHCVYRAIIHGAIHGDTAGCATAVYTGPSSMVPSRGTLQVQLCIQGHHPAIQDDTAGCATAVLRKEHAVHTVYTGPSSMVPSRMTLQVVPQLC